MRKSCWLILFVLLFASCAKEGLSNFPLDGVYTGIYLQTGSEYRSAHVRLIFVGNGYSGDSDDTDKTICYGNYEFIIDSIDFKSLCATPQDQLLLAGKYNWLTAGDSLYLTRDSTVYTSYKEQFILSKQ